MGLAWASGKLLSSGSKDHLIKISDGQGQVLSEVEIPTYAKSLDLLNGKILAGTYCGRILVIDEQSKQKKEIMHGHSQG